MFKSKTSFSAFRANPNPVHEAAHRILDDPKMLEQHVAMSRLCKWTKEECRYYRLGKCICAHSPEELRLVDCVFGDSCWGHNTKPSCFYYHPRDGDREICERKLRTANYFINCSLLCPKQCDDPVCTYAHTLNEVKVKERCPNRREQCGGKCLKLHEGETREQFAKAVNTPEPIPQTVPRNNQEEFPVLGAKVEEEKKVVEKKEVEKVAEEKKENENGKNEYVSHHSALHHVHQFPEDQEENPEVQQVLEQHHYSPYPFTYSHYPHTPTPPPMMLASMGSMASYAYASPVPGMIYVQQNVPQNVLQNVQNMNSSPSTASLSSVSSGVSHNGFRSINFGSLEEMIRERDTSMQEFNEIFQRIQTLNREITRLEKQKAKQSAELMGNCVRDMLSMYAQTFGPEQVEEIAKNVVADDGKDGKADA